MRFTADLYHLADWLKSCGVKTVAMQCTSVYSIPLYGILEERALRCTYSMRAKNLPGRKNDVQESQWLLKLHSYGLLNNYCKESCQAGNSARANFKYLNDVSGERL